MLHDAITSIKGIGPRRAELLGKLGLFSIGDLLNFAPRAYIDYEKPACVTQCPEGMDAAIRVTVQAEPKLARIRKGLSMVSVRVCDETGKTFTLVWFNQPYRKGQLRVGECLYACGKVDRSYGVRMLNPALSVQFPGILPVYTLTKGLTQRILRDAIEQALSASEDELSKETMPLALRERYDLAERSFSQKNLHFPQDQTALLAAQRRLAFEDMLVFRLMLESFRAFRQGEQGIAFSLGSAEEKFNQLLPFALTGAQQRVMEEIASDMQKPLPMNRLVQGDVGCGKTVLAFFAMYVAVQNGFQAALMAPTEILAEQHYLNLKKTFGEDEVVLLRGGMKKLERSAAYASIEMGEAKYIVGTHALLQSGVAFKKLGIVITDEQHRFGVRQRAQISSKGVMADVLIMSATPIPRTLAMILYGDLDVSVVDELPAGRKPIRTRRVPPDKRMDMYRFIENEVKNGRQAYVVCPLVEKSEALENMVSATELYAELKDTLNARVALLHGQMDAERKREVTSRFLHGETDILVTTTVVEVGVDVPNATVMAIENADRFGLAQLHQLRGRVGRGSAASYCFLLSESASETAEERLDILTKSQDGFEIAQKDLSMRGPGELLGERQHGLGELSAMQLAADMQVFTAAQQAAEEIMQDPMLQQEARALCLRAQKLLEKKMKNIVLN